MPGNLSLIPRSHIKKKKKTLDETVGICNPNTQVGTGETPGSLQPSDPGAYSSCLRNKVKKQAAFQKSYAPDHTRAMAPCAPIFTHTDMHRQPQ